MIKEIVQFTKNLDEGFKNLGVKPREGLHIVLKLTEENGVIRLDTDNILCERYTNTKKLAESEFLEKCKFLSTNAWCIDTNKCFDLPAKAIHSCSPFCVAFKREHLEGGEKYARNQNENKKQIHERLGDYFTKALELLATPQEQERYKVFEAFFIQRGFECILKNIFSKLTEETKRLSSEIEALKEQQKNESNKEQKELLKQKITELEQEKEKYKPLEDADYIIFYLDEPLEKYKEVHQKYLSDKLFNTAQYNTEPDENGDIYGTSNFFNSYNQNMPFLLHKTATFDITGRISDKDAKYLYEFEQVLARNVLPKPLPIFIFKEELQKNVIAFFKESKFKASYREIIEGLWEKHKDDFGNYYLLFYANTKDGLVFKDFDFVTKFEYELRDSSGRLWEIENLFELWDKDKNQMKIYPTLSNVFDLEQVVFKTLIGNKYRSLDYFKDLDLEDYKDRNSTPNRHFDNTFNSYTKYRKAVYDFVYKSKRQSITVDNFKEMVFNGIQDDLKQNNPYGIKDKLNFWFSLYEKFDIHSNPNHKTMASKLKEYREFMEALAEDKADVSQASLEQFAFAAGQVIYYILQKSKSADTSYQRLEPYLQQVSCEGLKKAIANDFARYKHETYSVRFERAAAFVLTYQTDANLKKVLPELLAGVFSNNQLFPKRNNEEINKVATSNN